MNPELKLHEEKMTKTISVLREELAAIRAGRANPAVLDKLEVDYYGVPTRVNQLAAVSVSEARTLVIQPYDKSTLKSIEKAIQASDIGINPNNDGTVQNHPADSQTPDPLPVSDHFFPPVNPDLM